MVQATKSQLYIAQQKSAGGLHDEKSDYAAKQIVAYKIILEKL